MSLWQIFVLSQVRLCKDLCYDDLHYAANQDNLIRQLMGVHTHTNFDKDSSSCRTIFTYQNVVDNVSLLDDNTVKEINKIIVAYGHQVFKKKRRGSIGIKNR